MKTYTQAAFNMVEIVLALVVIVIGIIGVMALFPQTQMATSTAITRDHSQNAADQFLRLIESKVKRNWAVLATIPISKPGPSAEADVVWKGVDTNDVITTVEGLRIEYNDLNNNGAFDFEDGVRDDSGVFRLSQRSGANLEDFGAVLRVWKTAATFDTYSVSSGEWLTNRPVPIHKGATLHCEVSYPASLPYEKREKSVYPLDVFRPGESEPADVEGAFQLAESGKLRFTYHGSEAGLRSSFGVIVGDDEEEIFESNEPTDQTETTETEYPGDTPINFYTETDGTPWGMTVYRHYAWADDDFQNCVALDGEVNINPNNNPNHIFSLLKADGGSIDRNDLHQKSPTWEGGVYWTGKATQIEFQPKGNGNQNTLTIDGVPRPVYNGRFYRITGDDMTVTVYNDHIKNGKAMGQWWFRIDTDCAVIMEDGKEIWDVRGGQAIPYYDWTLTSPNQLDGAFDYLSGNPYAVVTELIPGRKWLIGFEDLPGDRNGDGRQDWIDWDYNDIVVTVELIVNDGVREVAEGVSVSGRIELNPNNQSDWRMTLTKEDGSFLDGTTLGNGYEGGAISLWARPLGPGSQTLTVDGQTSTFSNEDMVCIAADNMHVNIRKIGGEWVADIEATNAFFVIIN